MTIHNYDNKQKQTTPKRDTVTVRNCRGITVFEPAYFFMSADPWEIFERETKKWLFAEW